MSDLVVLYIYGTDVRQQRESKLSLNIPCVHALQTDLQVYCVVATLANLQL